MDMKRAMIATIIAAAALLAGGCATTAGGPAAGLETSQPALTPTEERFERMGRDLERADERLARFERELIAPEAQMPTILDPGP